MTFPQDAVLWALLVVALVAVGAVLRARKTNIRLRRQASELRAEREGLWRQRDEWQAAQTGLLHRHAAELADVRRDAEEETKAVLKAAVRTLQGLADQQQVVIEKAQTKYGDDPQILADLMAIDHANSQFGRRAQGIAVLCGGWLGRRETVASVFDVARSAQGRIRHFDRVRINGQVNFSVVSKAVEPVAVVLAELMANATNYSAPGTPVEINIQAVPSGVCLIVDDAGLGMGQEEKDRAGALLDPRAEISVSSLGIPPQFGFAVSGLLAARYGFKVSVDSVSPYGGVRAVILLPDELLTGDVPPAPVPVTRDTAVPAAAPPLPGRSARTAPTPLFPDAVRHEPVAPAATQPTTTAGGLPKRRRQSPVSVLPTATAEAAPAEVPPVRSNQETASRLGAFQRGTRSGRDTTTMEGPENQ
ncbi:ATP-binding protein [Streptomyces sp. NBC_01218]|uniref:ATP-binding protein n=1 Tax=unclassified Streptomyces TaxID=2593676 RepID=UPI0023B8BB31|nr:MULTISPECIES: ATP-binding protein [unclassified Streptomyces]WEH40614.1 ATP-binding protein [Streptomyces sp. AM 2-1-1]WSQ52350.1 ATP-binding protein [Streptomyces sp. NBC_01218]